MINLQIKPKTDIDAIVEQFIESDASLWLALGQEGILSKDTTKAVKEAIKTHDYSYLGLILYSQVIAFALSTKENGVDLS